MSDTFGDEPEQTYSIHEYLSNVEDQELEADLVLGGDEGKECTYSKGYMKRQAIFSCLTCTPKGTGGVCTACSLSCHDGHEVVELWTKRNFKCDCGNSKFGDVLCKLFPDKDIENVSNSYNHNFKGAYCTCGHPYPDHDAEEQVEMIQCCICEDWFHEEHLGLSSSDGVAGVILIPRDDEGEPQYEDFICRACSPQCSFLTHYPVSLWDAKMNSEKNIISSQSLNNEKFGYDTETMGEEEEGAAYKRNDSADCNESTTMECILGFELGESLLMAEQNGPLFLLKSWREMLCKCHKCTEFCRKKGVGFLLDKEDSIVEYEKMGKQKREEKMQEQEGMEASFINKLGHVQKLELLNGIADMKNEIQAFLESCDSSKTITSDDVGQMFQNLTKKRRREM